MKALSIVDQLSILTYSLFKQTCLFLVTQFRSASVTVEHVSSSKSSIDLFLLNFDSLQKWTPFSKI